MRGPPETDSQALLPGLDLKSPGKEYNPLFYLMGRLPKRASCLCQAQTTPLGTGKGPATYGGLAGRKEVVSWCGVAGSQRRCDQGRRKITLVPDERTN